ncbi:MAG TPA: chemotaxis response regulator protein-glutamate methylesterase [bacterium]|nr:chemotaxis response regulator protein-glutamate methylesterase [bacterium]
MVDVRNEKIKVLIIDDSATVRRALEEIITAAADMTVIGTAADAYEARDIMRREMPDVITLDVEMPRMDGLTFLDKVMRAVPVPVLMISSLTQENALITLRSLELGAVDYITKPAKGLFINLEDLADEILEKIRAANGVPRSWLERHRYREKMTLSPEQVLEADEADIVHGAGKFITPQPLIALGASTGGTIAIEQFLRRLDAHRMPPIVIVQHIPQFFSRSFAERLDALFNFSVREAVNGHELRPGDVVVAEGGKHLMVERTPAGYMVISRDGPRVNRHKPSIDVLFKSVAAAARNGAIGVILTGMGNDGAKGMLEIQLAGGLTFAQRKEGCPVYSMPRAAVEMGAVRAQLSVEGIAGYLNHIFEGDPA